MKEIGLLFSTPMVQAEQEGRKTMTRRAVKPQPPIDFVYLGTDTDRASGEPIFYACWEGDKYHNVKCPYGQIGDVLWVREKFYAYGHWTKTTDLSTGKVEWEFQDLTISENLEYKYFDNSPELFYKRSDSKIGWYKRPSLFMPKAACRTFLEITNIRVERLNDISEEDAIAEGIKPTGFMSYFNTFYENYLPEGYTDLKPIDSFKTLWQSINGKDSWEANPWVWVIEFKRFIK